MLQSCRIQKPQEPVACGQNRCQLFVLVMRQLVSKTLQQFIVARTQPINRFFEQVGIADDVADSLNDLSSAGAKRANEGALTA